MHRINSFIFSLKDKAQKEMWFVCDPSQQTHLFLSMLGVLFGLALWEMTHVTASNLSVQSWG